MRCEWLTNEFREAFKVTNPPFANYEVRLDKRLKHILATPENKVFIKDLQVYAMDVESFIVEICYPLNHGFAYLPNALGSAELFFYTVLDKLKDEVAKC